MHTTLQVVGFSLLITAFAWVFYVVRLFALQKNFDFVETLPKMVRKIREEERANPFFLSFIFH